MASSPLSIRVLHLVAAAFVPVILAQNCRNNAALPLPAQTIFQFPPGSNFTFFENIASRANGDLIVTMAVPDANIFLLQNPGSACPTMSPLFQVPGVNGTDGITELADRPDVFAVIAGNLSLSGNPANGVPDTWSVWELDLSGGTNGSATDPRTGQTIDCAPGATVPPAVTARKIADVPQGPRLNGIAAVPGTSAVLVGDSELGVAFRIDTVTGAVTTALDFPAMKPVPNQGSADDALGLNGMKIAQGFLYFTNAAGRTVNRVAILPDGSGPAPGAAVELIANVSSAGWLDDLDLREDGSLWVTTNVSCVEGMLQVSCVLWLTDGRFKSPTNEVLVIEPTVANTTGAAVQFLSPVSALGGPANLTVAGDVAGVFGRGPSGSQMLYVATGSGDEPAKVVRVDTSPCQ